LIVTTGGETRAGTFTENEAYEVKTGRWLTLAPLPGARHGHGAAVIGNGLYFVAAPCSRAAAASPISCSCSRCMNPGKNSATAVHQGRFS